MVTDLTLELLRLRAENERLTKEIAVTGTDELLVATMKEYHDAWETIRPLRLENASLAAKIEEVRAYCERKRKDLVSLAAFVAYGDVLALLGTPTGPVA